MTYIIALKDRRPGPIDHLGKAGELALVVRLAGEGGGELQADQLSYQPGSDLEL